MVRRLPPEVARPAEIVTFYKTEQWKQAAPWVGPFNPLSDSISAKFLSYAGIAIKVYTRAVDRIPFFLNVELAN
jgi:hypothetical protein